MSDRKIQTTFNKDLKAIREALEFYTKPNVYEPDFMGRRGDIKFVAANGLRNLDRLEEVLCQKKHKRQKHSR